MELVFATNNLHKLSEVQTLIGGTISIKSLRDIGYSDEIPEDHETIEENASQKAFFIYDKFRLDCFADDTGLEIDSLEGRPGVYSARYAGENCSFDDNMNKVLEELRGQAERAARFRTVISLVIDGKEQKFEGMVNGVILTEKRGDKGFGYDEIFQPDGFELSFAQMSLAEKNEISHRAIASVKLAEYLTGLAL